MNTNKRWTMSGMAVVLGLTVLLLVGGCASDKRPTAQLSNADLAVQRARQANANDYAPLELKLAEDKLSQARTAEDKEKYKEARRLADESLADAQAAESKARAERTKQAQRQMQESITTLQREITPTPMGR